MILAQLKRPGVLSQPCNRHNPPLPLHLNLKDLKDLGKPMFHTVVYAGVVSPQIRVSRDPIRTKNTFVKQPSLLFHKCDL